MANKLTNNVNNEEVKMEFGNYPKLKEEMQQRVNQLPLHYAYSDKQFKRELEKMGLTDSKEDLDKLVSIGYGGFILKTDKELVTSTFKETEKIKQDYLNDREHPENLLSAFEYELANHEFCITYDYTDTLAALGMDWNNLEQWQLDVLVQAKESYLANCNY